jgi:TetR/AcrR family transcriptional regulator, fatty acid metabolism regulator protein
MAKKRFGTNTRREQIAEAALDIVRNQGIKALNVAAVAQKMDMVPSALYRHFKNKNEIVTAVLELIGTRLNAHFQQVANLDLDPLERLRLLLTRHIELISSNNAIPRIIFSEEVIGGDPNKRRQLFGIIEKVLDNVAAIIRDGQRRGTIRDDLPAKNLAVSFLGMIQPASIIWNLSNGEFDLVHHSRAAWKLFSDSVRAGPKK